MAPIEMLNFRHYEADETKVMLALLKESSVILDVGANIGWYSLLFARRFPGASVHAFEPLPYFSDFLLRNVVHNELGEQISVHRIGLSDEIGTLDLHIEKGNGTNASLRNVAGADVEHFPVEVCTMDLWCRQNGVAPDFVKCDVEGAELLVMRGAKQVLAEHRPILFLELLRKWSRPYDYHPNDLIGYLAELGYKCFGIDISGVQRVYSVDEDTVPTN